jgi:hypothetical protein
VTEFHTGSPISIQRVSLENLSPGMKLARAVTSQSGLVVVAAGVVLNEALIERLRRVGPSALYVEGLPSTGKDAAEQEQELVARFRKVQGDPVQRRILETVRSYLFSIRAAP